MSYLSRMGRNGKTYYYLVENISVGKGRRKQIRKYIGLVKPSENQLPNLLSKFERDIKTDVNKLQGHIYLTTDDINAIEKINSDFWKKYNNLTKTEKEQFLNNFITIFVYNTNSIEGSTLTQKEVELLLSENIAPNRPLEEVLEAKSAKNVFEYIINYKNDLSIDFIIDIHRMYFKDSQQDIAGRFKRLDNRVTGSKFNTTPKELVITDMKLFIENYYKLKKELHPIELAAWVHWKLVRIHPFQDGNGRVARLLMNFVLFKNHFGMIDIKTKERLSYIKSLEKCNYLDNAKPLAQRLVKRFKKQYLNALN
jgi:Fic family protein